MMMESENIVKHKFPTGRQILYDPKLQVVIEDGEEIQIQDWISEINPSDYIQFDQGSFNRMFWDQARPLYHPTTSKEETKKIERLGLVPTSQTDYTNLPPSGRFSVMWNNIKEIEASRHDFDSIFRVDIQAMKNDEATFRAIRAFPINDESSSALLRYLILSDLGVDISEFEGPLPKTLEEIQDCWIAVPRLIPPKYLSKI